MAAQEKTILVDGLTIRYWEDGQENGRVLILLHGGTGDAFLHWGKVIPLLAETFHVLAPDLPGFGKSDRLPRMQTMTVVHWIKAFLDTLGIEQAVVVGNSLGGLLARLFAVTYPEKVPALVLVNGGGVPEMPAPLRLVERIPGLSGLLFALFGRLATASSTLNRMIHIKTVLDQAFMQNARAAGRSFAAMMRMLVSSPFPPNHTPPVPTLILWGADDQVATLNQAAAIRDSIPGSTLTEIKDCGHMPQLETPDVFVWQVNQFLEKLSRPRKSSLPGAGILPNLSG